MLSWKGTYFWWFSFYFLFFLTASEPEMLLGIKQVHDKYLQPQPDLTCLSVIHHQLDTNCSGICTG